jgi:serine/threonine-protein kinase
LATAINIPVNDTTQPIDGGVVRYYDVAIAQAVAITYQSCKDRNEQGADLFLTAGNQGQINMGRFYISCNLAYDLGIAYGLNDSVSRPVRSWGGNYWKHMPSLNLNTDAKARQFVSFSSNFKPVEQ